MSDAMSKRYKEIQSVVRDVVEKGPKGADYQFGATSTPPVRRGSTLGFESLKALSAAEKHSVTKQRYRGTYGRYGLEIQHMLGELIRHIEWRGNPPEDSGVVLVSSGLLAISTAFLSLVKAGDHVCIVDGFYEPGLVLLRRYMSQQGVDYTVVPDDVGENIVDYLKPNTKLIALESPASITGGIQELDVVVSIAKQRGILTMMDSTWSSAVLCSPQALGIDVAVYSLTKYMCGHSDVLMGAIVARGKCLAMIDQTSKLLGAMYVGPDEAYLVLRGIQTLPLRMRAQAESAREILAWLRERPEIETILSPCIGRDAHTESDDIQGQRFKKYFSDNNSLISFVLADKYGFEQLNAMTEALKIFKLGYSWGGCDSCVLAYSPREMSRRKFWSQDGFIVRLHIGLSDVSTMIDDLSRAFSALNNTPASK